MLFYGSEQNKVKNMGFKFSKKTINKKSMVGMVRLDGDSLFSPNAGKCGPEKLRIRTLFTQ